MTKVPNMEIECRILHRFSFWSKASPLVSRPTDEYLYI